MSQENETEVVEKITNTIESQKPALDESEWADPPELTEQEEQQLVAASKESAAATEYDDTNHADGEQEAAGNVEKASGDEVPPEPVVVQKETAPKDSETKFDPLLLQAAGLDEKEAREQFGSPKALENAIRLIDARSIQAAKSALTQVTQPPAPPLQQKPQEIPAEVDAEFKMPEPPEGEEWDESTVELVKHLNEQFSRKLEQQKRELEEQRLATQEFLAEKRTQELKRYVDEFDGFVNKLAEPWKKVFGAGSGYDLNPNSAEFKSRVQLDETVKQLAFGRSQQGLPPLPQDELMSRALRVAFPQQQETAIRKQVEKEVSERKSMTTNRPTGRAGGKQVVGVDAAAATAEKWYRERGMSSLPSDDFEYEDI